MRPISRLGSSPGYRHGAEQRILGHELARKEQ